ncbi:hypothetical protein Aperf_G00000096652 [Anoplocephala perfoliata]
MASIHASLQNEILLTEQSCRSLMQTKSELEFQVAKLRNDLAIAERDLLRLQASIDSYQRASAILIANASSQKYLIPISFSLPIPHSSLSSSSSSSPVSCTMHTCFNWTACSFHTLPYLRVCFQHESTVSNPRWQHALLTSPHFSTSCSRACLRVIFTPEACDSYLSCIYIGPPSGSLSPFVIRASIAHSIDLPFRPGFDLILAPLGQIPNESPPSLIVRRQTKWLLGASLGTFAPSEMVDPFLSTLMSGVGKYHLVNVKLENSPKDCFQGGDNSTLWRPCDDSGSILSVSTFCLLVDSVLDEPSVSEGSPSIGEQLIACLRNAAIPVFASRGGGVESLLFPFWEILDSNWRQAVVFLPRARLPHLVAALDNLDKNARVEMLLQGQEIYRKYLSTAEKQLATIFLTLSRRLGLPQPPAPLTRSTPALVSGRLQPERVYQPRPEVLAQVDVDGLLGPLGPRWDSPAQPSFMLLSSAISSRVDPFWTHTNTPWSSPFLPTEFQFVNVMNTNNFRPINHTIGTAGREFAADIGGMYPYEQFTIAVLTYDRDPILTLMLEGLMNLAYLHSVIVIWNNPKPPSENILWPQLHVPIHVVRSGKNSLNNRFLPYDIIKTEAVLMLDDDVTLRHDEIVLGFRVWRENRDRIVGFPARGHFWSSTNQSWYYNSAHSCEYSMVLTGAAFIHRYYLHAYTNEMPAQIREIVEQELNCEDIAMNFLVSHITRKPPLKVTTHWSFICTNCNTTLYNGGTHKTNMTDPSNRSRPEQLLQTQSSIVTPHLIAVSSSASNVSPAGSIAPPRSVTPLIVRTAANNAANLPRNLVFIRPSNATIAAAPRFIVQPNSQARPILPQTVVSQPVMSSSSPSTSSTQAEPPRITARAALLRNASIPIPISNKPVSRSFELRHAAIPGPESNVTSAVAETARHRASVPQSDDESECLSGEIIKRMQASESFPRALYLHVFRALRILSCGFCFIIYRTKV